MHCILSLETKFRNKGKSIKYLEIVYLKMSGKILAIGMYRNKPGIHKVEIDKPKITKPNQVLIKVIQTGVDGTDFNIVKHNLQDIEEGKNFIILGHETMGIIVDKGKKVRKFKKGDLVTVTVRRGCNICSPCLHNQSDMCMTGLYKERGIHKMDGFLTKYIVDEEDYIVKIPKVLENYGNLIEPFSIMEKAIEQIRIVQRRMPWGCKHPRHDFSHKEWGRCKNAIVIGSSTQGFMGSALLRLANVNTTVVARSPETTFRARMVKKLGCKYVSSTNKTPEEIIKEAGEVDIVIDAAGASELALNLIKYTSRSSIHVFVGIPRESLHASLDANTIMRQIVRYNQAIVGILNSNRKHFEMAIKDLQTVDKEWPGILDQIITHRFKISEYEKAFNLKDPEQMKIVIDME